VVAVGAGTVADGADVGDGLGEIKVFVIAARGAGGGAAAVADDFCA
jgi:hypothetical protein